MSNTTHLHPSHLRRVLRLATHSTAELADLVEALHHTLPRPIVGGTTQTRDGKLAVMVHGLCMNGLQWNREGHDHIEVHDPRPWLYPRYRDYNSGLQVSTDGRTLAGLLDVLLKQWPLRVEELVIVGWAMDSYPERRHRASR